MALYGGGAVALLKRDPGTANAIQGARGTGSPLFGGRLTTALPVTILFRAQDGIAQINPNLVQSVGQSYATSYIIRATVGQEYATSYTIQSGGTSAVGQDFATSYTIRNAVGQSYPTSYLVRAAVGRDFATTYVARATVGFDFTTTYDVASGVPFAVGRDFPISYQVLGDSSRYYGSGKQAKDDTEAFVRKWWEYEERQRAPIEERVTVVERETVVDGVSQFAPDPAYLEFVQQQLREARAAAPTPKVTATFEDDLLMVIAIAEADDWP